MVHGLGLSDGQAPMIQPVDVTAFGEHWHPGNDFSSRINIFLPALYAGHRTWYARLPDPRTEGLSCDLLDCSLTPHSEKWSGEMYQ